ncbi:hypothetical protein E1B28_002798 [Marasmius oreades]|uniref:Xylanolytic transcriptional activator regulatory domain-containing protein n=1 Tax=Marasmius oreades TaxID=181124 RepID=A0A9P7RPW0_9AGAR|nr:uncharacterized protein E1B28_002798 [Marasmius oreades]KAG7086878.1 hypothetical protein E1B28_002798 [Marasmius oreades]
MPGNSCSNCLSFRTECTHIMAMAKKKRGPPRGTPRGQKTIQSIVKSILSTSKPYVVPDDPEDLRQVLVDLANRIVTLEEELDEIRRSKTASGDSPAESGSSGTSTSPPSMADTYYTAASVPPVQPCADACISSLVADFVKQLRVNQAHERHYGQHHNVNLLINALDLERDIPGKQLAGRVIDRRAEFWNIHPWQAEIVDPDPNYVFPEEDLMNELINLYFAHVNCYYPILHRGLFEKAVAEHLHLHDRYFAAVLLVVCAAGSRYSNDARVLDDPQCTLSAGWKWFRQIRLIRSNFIKPPCVYELQLYCIAIFFVQGTSTPETCWILLGLGVRYAQDLGIHRKPPPNHKPTVQSQLWNRAFWALIAIDVVMSSFLGRPRATHTDDFDLPLPIECDDEYWEMEDPDQAFKQPLGKPCSMSYWVEFLKLLDIVGFAQRTIYAVRKSDMWTRMGMSGPEWNEKIVAELDSALNYWVGRIPQHLKWDPNQSDSIWSNQSTILYMTYYWVQILIHKPFISPTTEEAVLTFPSLSICANAARSCCHLAEVQSRKAMLLFPTTLNAIYSSAIILFLNTWRGNQMKTTPDTYRELRDVYKCLVLLGSIERSSQVAGRFCDIINELLAICGLPTNRTSALKRSQTRTMEEDSSTASSDEGEEEGEESNTLVSTTRIVHPRPIAGSRRVSASTSTSTNNNLQASGTEYTYTPSADSTFSLPTSSAELGSLPLHEAFAFPSSRTWFPEQTSLFSPTGLFQFETDHGAFAGGVVDPDLRGRIGSSLPESSYMNRFMAESLSSAFGNAGPGISFAFEGQMGTQPSIASTTATTGSWTDWNSYMAGLDEMLQGFPATV